MVVLKNHRFLRVLALFLLSITIVSVPARKSSAQSSGGAISGQCVDVTSGAPLSGVSVHAALETDTTSGKHTFTNAQGKYRIKDLRAGKYKVTFSLLGYRGSASSIDVAAQPTTLDMPLAEEALHSEEVIISASRHEEKATSAPASVSVIPTSELREHVSATPTEILGSVPGMDLSHEGMAMSTYASRSMHSVFGSDILTMNDYHSMEVPSIGGFYGILMPQMNEDIDHIEVVRGPGSALYGPEAATGVVHFISKSPFTSQGTSISLAGGARGSVTEPTYSGFGKGPASGGDYASGSYFDGGFRHAQAIGDRFAFKISGHYLKADDWHMAADTSEAKAYDTAQAILATPNRKALYTSSQQDSLARIGNRNYGLEVYSFEARADAILSDDATLNLTGGLTKIVNDIAMTEDFGSAQIKNWSYDFVQARLNYKDLFFQVALNGNDTKDSYFLPTGGPIVNRSTTTVVQIQHQWSPMTNEKLTYGADYQSIHPISDATIWGPDDGHNNVSIIGGYLQSQTTLMDDALELVLAGRVDKHSYLSSAIFSPRAAAVYHINDQHLVRAMYNETYLFPSENDIFGDILFANDAFGFAGKGLPFVGPNIRYVTPYVSGMTFQHSSTDPTSYDMNTTLNLDPRIPGTLPASQALNVLWPVLMQVAGGDPRLAQLKPFLSLIPAPTSQQVPTFMAYLNLHPNASNPGQFVPVTNGQPLDIAPVKAQHATSLELDYQGSIASNFQFEIDAYQTHYDAIRASTVALTPNVFASTPQLQAYLDTTLLHGLESTGMRADSASLNAFLASNAIAGNLGQLPLGVVQPAGSQYAVTNQHIDDVLIGTRTYLESKVEFYGVDASFEEKASDDWSFNGSFSMLTKNYWYAGELNAADSGSQNPFALNMPKYRGSIGARYSGLTKGLSLELRDRWSDAFKMVDNYWVGDVGARHVLDLTVNYRMESWNNLMWTLSVTNVLNNLHQELIGAPQIGRLTVLRASYTLPSF